jgi:hypothetical protein
VCSVGSAELGGVNVFGPVGSLGVTGMITGGWIGE